MTPDEFYGIYGDALAGKEQKADATKPASSSPGASKGTSASAQAKTARARSVVQPVLSQADTFDDSAIQSTDTGLPPPEPPMPPPPPAPRVPLYTQAQQALTAPPVAPGAPRPPVDLAAKTSAGYAKMWNDISSVPEAMYNGLNSATGGELGFQTKPITDDYERYKQLLMKKLRGEE